MIFVIDSDEITANCVAKATQRETRVFSNAIEAMMAITDGEMPELILMEVLLMGPDGFTFLNELISYEDTAKIPIVIISTVDFGGRDLSTYGVVGVLNKDTMLPEEVLSYVEKYAR